MLPLHLASARSEPGCGSLNLISLLSGKFRTSGGKGIKSWTASRPRKTMPMPPPSAGAYKNVPKVVEREAIITEGVHKAALYIFLEKAKIKVKIGLL